MLRIRLGSLALLALAVACGDDSGVDSGPDDGGGGTDTGMSDGGVDSGDEDGGGNDAGVDAGMVFDCAGNPFTPAVPTSITISGELFVEAAPAIGGPGPVVTGPHVTADGRVNDSCIRLLTEDGRRISETRTSAMGAYQLFAPADTLTFLQADPIEAYAGRVRVEDTRRSDYMASSFVQSLRMGMEDLATDSGTTHDVGRGWIAAGFNPIEPEVGGEGAEVAGTAHDPAVIITSDGTLVADRLPPLCSAAPSDPDCVDTRVNQVFIPNTVPGFVTVTPLSPASGGTCSLRFDTDFLVAPDSMTVVNIDCM